MIVNALCGQLCPYRIESLLEGSRHFECVGSELGGGLDEQPGLAGDERIAEARFRCIFNRSQVTEADGNAGARSDHRVGQVVYCLAGGLCTNDDALCRRLDIPTSQSGRSPPRSAYNVIERQVVRSQPRGIDRDLSLPYLPAAYLRLRETRHGEQLR